ncbi:MAG: TraR/DksA family transcriptional regulator [Candidatus Peribacteraceae bacterium]|nr:TraR/DksA family transcriptional regulator [Candidatus Peribacteraceae bacterium]
MAETTSRRRLSDIPVPPEVPQRHAGSYRALAQRRTQLQGVITSTSQVLSEQRQSLGGDLTDCAGPQIIEGVHLSLLQRANEEEQQVIAAIETLQGKTAERVYGECIRCGKKIPKARLNAVPYASTCVKCQRDADKEQ